MHYLDGADDSQLFKHFVKTLVSKKCDGNFYTTNQFANLIFGKGDSSNMARVSRVCTAYRNYFDRQGIFKKRLNVSKVQRDHPGIFGSSSKTAQRDISRGSHPSVNKLDGMIAALKDEMRAIRQGNQPIKVNRIQYEKKSNDKYIYKAFLRLDSDDDLTLNEGALIKLMPIGIQGAILFYDQINAVLFFELSGKVNPQERFTIEVDSTSILQALVDVLYFYQREGVSSFAKTFADNEFSSKSVFKTPDLARYSLDHSQKSAARKSIESSTTFIWGPPGTGKSQVLSVILDQLMGKDEKTLVVSIANVAVDQLLDRTLSLIDVDSSRSATKLINHGDILRIGYITQGPLAERFENAPPNQQILTLYAKLREIHQNINVAKTEKARAELIAEKRSLSREIDRIQKSRIDRCKLLFTTSTKAVIDQIILGTVFDNLVIDEASMMGIPYLFGLLKSIKKRVVIAGDFAQLAPIALAQTQLSDRYLKKDVFSIAGISTSNIDHPCLSILTDNRRSTFEVCAIYNNAFYGGKMIVSSSSSARKSRIHYYESPTTGAVFTDSKSRKNPKTFDLAVKCVDELLRNTDNSVGLLAPYRAQINDYKKYFKDEYPREFDSGRLKIGTIHTFQGSEADTIVFDTVDTSDVGVCKLYLNNQGERLVNVAISRARSGLLLVGDLKAFYQSNQVSPRVLKALNQIKSKSV